MASKMTFNDWMENALYGGTGYYATAKGRSGREGDYFTAPDTGPAFGQLLAAIFQQWQEKLKAERFTLVEAGAGEGHLAKVIRDQLPQADYAAVECSSYRQYVLSQIPDLTVYPDLTPLVASPIEGILFANELIDALPVHRIRKHEGKLEELHFVRFQPTWLPLTDPAIKKYLKRIAITLPEGYETEVNLAMSTWIRQAASAVKRGLIVLIDYGRPAWDYYAEERTLGTLRFYKEHQVHSLSELMTTSPRAIYPSRNMDITADVDFTSLALDAREAGLKVLGFMEMGTFLGGAPVEALAQAKGASQLLRPDGLGAQFHVLILGKGVDPKDWTFEFNRLNRLGLP